MGYIRAGLVYIRWVFSFCLSALLCIYMFRVCLVTGAHRLGYRNEKSLATYSILGYHNRPYTDTRTTSASNIQNCRLILTGTGLFIPKVPNSNPLISIPSAQTSARASSSPPLYKPSPVSQNTAPGTFAGSRRTGSRDLRNHLVRILVQSQSHVHVHVQNQVQVQVQNVFLSQ
ncbi:uncharacterized protein EURHEDRAFT_17588 [Aspergillus ruber CBS 135680]|uniref:Uncharacterized protein n=1 Tax=Aspergillus ruber (strain CBS 135680) TaxID=1388766 RepID=A0A017SSC9_ASPRC|nr:uncharacterized protein EURHEDRAFT_17588 [Aspergillus ruber CBS 135680]EYE99484.1 hypothetical protein EURHEDRAFT_17588 [Aspergillus ruber CBS 135680]